jgi:hypothetical protein
LAAEGVIKGSGEERVGAGLNYGEWCFEFVRDTADEIASHSFEASDIGDIANDDDSAGLGRVLNGNGNKEMVGLISGISVFEGADVLFGEAFLDGVEECGDANSFVESVSGCDAIADGEQSACAGVKEENALIVVDGDDAFDHGIEYSGEQMDGGGGVASGLFESEDAILKLIFQLVECVCHVPHFVLSIGDIQEHVVAVIALNGRLEFAGHDLEWRDDTGGDNEQAECSQPPGDQSGLDGDGCGLASLLFGAGRVGSDEQEGGLRCGINALAGGK